MKKKILIIGRSGSGKDTLAISLTEQFQMKQLCSTTTRPKRYENENTHVFVSEEEAEKLTERVAETIINGYQYFATKQQLEECDTYVVDPRGLNCICKNAPETPVCVVYVQATDDIRKKRAIARAADAKEAAMIFEQRQVDENKQFCEFENDIANMSQEEMYKKYPNVTNVIIFNNDSDTAKVDRTARAVRDFIRNNESPFKIKL